MAITNKEINLAQLTDELGGKGLVANFSDLENKLILPAEGVALTEKQLADAIRNHVAIDDSAARAAARSAVLERLGITESEAKLLLS